MSNAATTNTNTAATSITNKYRIERLPNGFIRVACKASGLVGLWNTDGTPRDGDLTYSIHASYISNLVKINN